MKIEKAWQEVRVQWDGNIFFRKVANKHAISVFIYHKPRRLSQLFYTFWRVFSIKFTSHKIRKNFGSRFSRWLWFYNRFAAVIALITYHPAVVGTTLYPSKMKMIVEPIDKTHLYHYLSAAGAHMDFRINPAISVWKSKSFRLQNGHFLLKNLFCEGTIYARLLYIFG